MYEEYTFHNNIWTASNILKDLVRFLYCKFTFYRHKNIDFIAAYNRQLPDQLTKYTFPGCHPHQLLMQKHKKVIFSLQSKPHGRYTKKMFIKPPKQMLSKWFFTKPFSKFPLVLIKAAACSFTHAYLSATNENMLVNIASINPTFYQDVDWDQNKSHAYKPYQNISENIQVEYKDNRGTTQTLAMKPAFANYNASVNRTGGWFDPRVLQATRLTNLGTHPAVLPTIAGRYNPAKDDGVGNEIYVTSTLAGGWDLPRSDKNLVITGMPLWLGLYGFKSFIETYKNKEYIKSSLIVIKSPAIVCAAQIGACDRYAPIDIDYIKGNKPYEQPIFPSEQSRWTPNITWQLKSLNALVESGPYIPKLSEERQSTWELKYHYLFCFKWGGIQAHDPTIKDPEDLPTYDVPDSMQKRIQIVNPENQAPETIIHPWDYRRGYIKERALKRMCENQSTDTEFEPSTEYHPKKKRQRMGAALQYHNQEEEEIQACLQELCKKNTFQESEETQTLQQLIQQQQQQQEQLRYNILKLLMELKDKQSQLQLQTGMFI